MLCEKCKKKKAVIYYNENIGGEIRSFNLCTECADSMRLSGELEEFSSAISGFSSPFTETPKRLSGKQYPLLVARTLPSNTVNKKCPGCGMTLDEISETGYIGCVRCYGFFAEELRDTIESLHLGYFKTDGKYCGGAPRSYREKLEKLKLITELRTQLASAVAKENYEQAATLRDRIREMETAICIK